MLTNIASLLPATPTVYTHLIEHGTSKTTWKTHALVVTGYLLMSVGIALVVASFYMSTIIHPLLALATPVTPIAAGSWLINHANVPILTLTKTSKAPFKGIDNLGNDCWIISTMQLLLHVPAFAKRIESVSRTFRFTSHPLQKVIDAFTGYRKGEQIDSKKLRDFLREKGVSSNDDSTQDDPISLISFFMHKIGYQLPTEYEEIISKEGDNLDVQATPLDPEHPVRFFTLALDSEKPSIEKGLSHYFKHTETTPSGIHRTITRFMKRPPEDFGISIGQSAENGIAVKKEVDCPMELHTPSSYFGVEASYSCDAFIYHHGQRANGGHWTAVIKQDGKWWHASDSMVSELSEAFALKMMKKASFIHYAKV